MPSVLFVCTANRIRSPLSEYLFKRALAETDQDLDLWRVDSAGTWTNPGLPAMPLAIAAGQEAGLDLSAHRSTRIEDVDLSSYDLIIPMEQGQLEALTFETPAIRDRVQLISKLATGTAYDVADPIGRPLDAYRTVTAELSNLIQRATPAIIVRGGG